LIEASTNTGKHFTIIEAVSVWNAMDKAFGGKMVSMIEIIKNFLFP